MTRIYRGVRESEVGGQPATVIYNGIRHKLPERQDIQNHSPDGFQWGFNGSGPAQLALAILAWEFEETVALNYYQDFKTEFVATWGDEWEITSGEIHNWIEQQS